MTNQKILQYDCKRKAFMSTTANEQIVVLGRLRRGVFQYLIADNSIHEFQDIDQHMVLQQKVIDELLNKEIEYVIFEQKGNLWYGERKKEKS